MSSDELIKHLCNRVIKAEGAEFNSAIRDLQAGLKAHAESLKVMACGYASKDQGSAPRSGRPLEQSFEPDELNSFMIFC
jgi:hypothetical protein